MVDFYEEPEKDCPKDPIDELNLKIEQYYATIYSKLFTHTSNAVVHITQDERDAWNNKASKEALEDLQNKVNSLTGDGDDSIKNQVGTELKEYINTIIAGLDINSYAKTEDISKLIANIDLSDYAEKEWCNNTFVKAGGSSGTSLDNYYTKSDVDKLINDYSIKKFAFKDDAFTIVQNGANNEDKTFIASISESFDGYLKKDQIHNIILNGQTVSLLSRDITINTSSSSGTSGKDGATYTPHFQNNNSSTVAPILPDDYKSPKNASTEEGRKWSTEVTTATSGQYTWMTYVSIDANGVYGKWLTPICLSGKQQDQQGLAGSPLRNKGEWNSSATYYDGHTTQVGDAFWQDFVSHTVNGIANYYVCTIQNSGKEPGISGNEDYWSLLSYTDDMFVNNLVAKKANIGELSANEIIISDSSNTVKAGMTNGKSTNVSGQGDVRIWAGSNGNGNIAEAPFTVTESGVLKASNAIVSGEINATSGTIGRNGTTAINIVNGNYGEIGLTTSTSSDWATTDTSYVKFTSDGQLIVGSTSETGKTSMNAGQFYVYSKSASDHLFTVDATTSTLKLCLKNLPTSSSGLDSGYVWNDNGTLKIVL